MTQFPLKALWTVLALVSGSAMSAPVSYTIDPAHTYGFNMDVALRIQVEAVAAP